MSVITRKEAIALCRVAPMTFDKYVRPKLTPITMGRRVLFSRENVEAVLSSGVPQDAPEPVEIRQTVSPGARIVAAAKSRKGKSDPRVQEIVERMRLRRERSEAGTYAAKNDPRKRQDGREI